MEWLPPGDAWTVHQEVSLQEGDGTAESKFLNISEELNSWGNSWWTQYHEPTNWGWLNQPIKYHKTVFWGWFMTLDIHWFTTLPILIHSLQLFRHFHVFARDRVTVFEVIIHDPKNHHFGLRDTTRGPTQAALQSTTIAVSSKWLNHSLENGYPLVK